MGFNYGLEKRKFTEEWKKLYREYKAAGMSEEDIQDIYAFDLNVFRKNRTEFQRTQPLSESSCDDGTEQGESMSALLKKFSSALSACDKYSFQSDPRFAWVDEMENDELYRKIISLPKRDMDLLTLSHLKDIHSGRLQKFAALPPPRSAKRSQNSKTSVWGLIFARFRCLPSEGIILKTKEQRNMNHLNEKNSVLNRPMYLCLCPVCLGQFLDTGIYKIVRENHGQAKERCDFCNYRNGYDFIIYSKAEKKDEVADEWQ